MSGVLSHGRMSGFDWGYVVTVPMHGGVVCNPCAGIFVIEMALTLSEVLFHSDATGFV